jgi:DNA-binding transcriptional MerR regulator
VILIRNYKLPCDRYQVKNHLYRETSGTLARGAQVAVATISLYAELGLLDFIRCSNGVKLFREGQAGKVREILAERMANRGRRLRADAG